MHFMSTLHILCFGDSLTAGWLDPWHELHPYAISMLESLEKSLPSVNISTDVQGLPGDQVVSPPGGFLPRIDILFEETEKPYDWAIILGGTNDLTLSRGAKDIWEGLKKVYDFPLSNNTKVLALTVMENCCGVPPTRRNKLNKAILEYEAENFYTFDLWSAFPFYNLTEERRNEIWHDGTHPNNAGYDIIGSLLATRLKGLIQENGAQEETDPVHQPLKVELKKRKLVPESAKQVVGRVLRSRKVRT